MHSDHGKHRNNWYSCSSEPQGGAQPPTPPVDENKPDSGASFSDPAAAPASQDSSPFSAAGHRDETKDAYSGTETYWQIVEDNKQIRTKRRVALVILFSVIAAAILFSLMWNFWLDRNAAGQAGGTQATPYRNIDDFISEYYTDVSGKNGLARTEARSDLSITVSEPGNELSLQEIYERIAPCVVGLTATSDRGSAWGSGVVIAPDGYILTNDHIIDTRDSATVSFSDGTELEAKLVAHDSQSDLALLKVEAENLAYAPFGDSDLLRAGDQVVAIGNPLGKDFQGTMTNGIISAISREVPYNGHTMTLLQTNAAINEGNSGGPLVNMYGQVIGITNMKMMSSDLSIEGIGFAIPTNMIQDIVEQLLESGYIPGRPSVGITVGAIPSNVAEYYDLPEGVYITEVAKDSGAEKAGLQPGDIITKAEGEAVDSTQALNAVKDTLQVGDSIHLTIYRDGQTLEKAIKLTETEAD